MVMFCGLPHLYIHDGACVFWVNKFLKRANTFFYIRGDSGGQLQISSSNLIDMYCHKPIILNFYF